MSADTSLREWFDEFTSETGETPIAIVFGEWPDISCGIVLNWQDIPQSLLDHPFCDGYGGTESPDLCAWSKSWVIFSDCYDGSERLCWIPRNPTAHTPIRPGGG